MLQSSHFKFVLGIPTRSCNRLLEYFIDAPHPEPPGGSELTHMFICNKLEL